MAENRLNRDLESREKKTRKRSWSRPETLPTPDPQDGWSFKWVRVSTRGNADPTNVTSKLRQGWEPVKALDHPEIELAVVENDRFKDNVVIGGLMLCKAPQELVDERNGYYREQSRNQMHSVDNNLMRESDPRMPIFNDRRSKVTFGKG